MELNDFVNVSWQRLIAVLLFLFTTGCATQTRIPTDESAVDVGDNSHTPRAARIEAWGIPVSTRAEGGSAGTARTHHEDIWSRLREGFELPDYRDKYVSYYENRYLRHPQFLDAMADRAALYLEHILSEVEKRGFPTEIALLPAVESSFKPRAYSRAGAAGLWQFMPETGKRFGLRRNWWYDGRYDITRSTQAALDYLSFLVQEFDGDWMHALAAYNAGETRIGKAINRNRKRHRPIHFPRLRIPSETRRYVPKLIALRNIVRDPAGYGITLKPIPNRPYFVKIDAGEQIELDVVAKLAAVEPALVRALNPAYRQGMTGPNGSQLLLLPKDSASGLSASDLKQALHKLRPHERIRWARYKIRRGDVLGRIAKRYRVSVAAIRNSNNLRSSRIYPGQVIKIPVSGAHQTALALADHSGASSKPRKQTVAQKRIHRIRKGGTLWKLSRDYGVSLRKLKKWNGLSSRSILALGQKILIYQ